MYSNYSNLKNKVVEKELSYKIVGILFKVHKELGRYCRERQYGDLLENFLKAENIKYQREAPVTVAGKKSNFVDFIIEDRILIDLKAKSFITRDDYFQMKRYLETSEKVLGLVVNFHQKYLNPKRVLNPKSNSKHSNKFVDLNYNTQKAFTLIELIIAIAMLALIAGVSVANFRSGERQKRLSFAVDGVINGIRNAQNLTLTARQIAASTCTINNNPDRAPKFYWITFNKNSTAYSLNATDKCDQNYLIETYTLPQGIEIAQTNGIQVNGVSGNVVSVLFEPPFALQTAYLDSSSRASFTSTKISLQIIGNATSRTVTIDGISGRIGEE